MAIKQHPGLGCIVTCDFDRGFKQPEMVKLRPVVVISPPISWRPGLCTVVGLSTTAPEPPRPYHCKLTISPVLPEPWNSEEVWVKGDMIAAVGFHRLDLIRIGRDDATKARRYRMNLLSKEQLRMVRACVLHSLGLFQLTKHLLRSTYTPDSCSLALFRQISTLDLLGGRCAAE
ncbi:MAG: type II toxin-antitoxin system PemK/MazF family toxin [Alphaproteobacteria bacterium]|nr:type II toxin-antitoxin system PemK/MazF family toxin [Alphaproteobacteria bacterium]